LCCPLYGNGLRAHLVYMQWPKLYYVPGFISLLALPVVLLVIHPEDPVRHNCIRMLLPTDEKPAGENVKYSRYSVLEAIAGKRITTVEFWYNPDYIELDAFSYHAKLDFVRREIERMNFTHDTMSVLKVELGDGITYGDFVRILNCIIIYRVKRYALVDNSLYVFASPMPPNPADFEPLDYDPHPVLIDGNYEKPTAWDKFYWKLEEQMRIIAYIIKYNYLLLSGFLLLIFLPALERAILKRRSLRRL
jgi:hypothetical protein